MSLNITSRSFHRFFFYLTVLLLPTQLGYHFWPEWSMVLGRRVDYLSPTIYLTDVLVILLLLSWFSLRAFRKFFISHFQFLIKFQFQKLHLAGGQAKLLMAIFILLFIVINIFVSLNQPVAIYKWIKVLEFGLFAYYIVKTKPGIPLVAYLLSLSILYSSVIAIGQFVFQRSIGGPLWFMGERTFTLDTPGIARFDYCQLSTVNCQLLLRAYGTFPHPNVLGGFLAITIPMLLQVKDRKWWYIVSSMLGVVALALTFSRSAIVFGALGIFVVMRHRARKYWSFLLALVVFVLVVYGLVTLDFHDESVVVRQQLTTAAVKIWQTSPLFGVGLGNFLVALPSFLPSREIYFLQPVHNVYLLFLSEVGLVGTGLIIFSLFISRKLFTVHCPLFTLLLLGFVDHYPLTLQQGQLLFALLVGLSFSHSSSPSDRIST